MVLLALALVASAHVATAQQTTPVFSVVELLKNLQMKAQEEQESEARTYAKYVEWCDDTKRVLEENIASENTQVDA
jgi:hypothetical protein